MINRTEPFYFYSYRHLPANYDDSMSYYEVVQKVVDFLNQVIDQTNEVTEFTEEQIRIFDTEFREKLETQYGDIRKLREELRTFKDKMETEDIPEHVYNVLNDFLQRGLLDDIFKDKPTSLVFTRPTEMLHKTQEVEGVYGINQPRYDMTGIIVDPSLNEKLQTSPVISLTTRQGMIEMSFIPLESDFTILFSEVTGGSFRVDSIGGKLRFYFGQELIFIESTQGITVNKEQDLILRWSEHSKIFELFLNGKYQGYQYFGIPPQNRVGEEAPPTEFLTPMDIVKTGKVIVSRVLFRDTARGVY